jgi:hypothetical protein
MSLMLYASRAFSTTCLLSRLSKGLVASRNLAACSLVLLTVALIGAGCNGSDPPGTSHNSMPSPTVSPAPTPSPTSTPIACTTGNAFTFTNNEPFPIWLAEAYQGSGNLAQNTIEPPNNDWEMAPNSSLSLCMPAGWTGRFWPRTECHFNTLFKNDPGYADCSSDSQCTAGHVCYGGKCMLDCTSGGTSFCQGSSGLNNASATCAPAGTSGVNVCTYPQGTVCKTGDCQGLYQCYGTWEPVGHARHDGTCFASRTDLKRHYQRQLRC